MRKIRNQKWFAKATALLISALLLVTMLPQAVMAADSDPTDQANMSDVSIEEEANAEEAVDDAVDAAIVSESNAEETAAAEDAATFTGAESVASAGSGEGDESGVTSIEVGTIELVEGVDGYLAGGSAPNPDGSWTYQEYFHYDPSYSKTARVTVTYNGQEYTGSFNEVSNQIAMSTGQWESFSFGYMPSQSYTNQWKVNNEYDVWVSFMGKTVSAKVRIIPSPITLFQIDPIEIIEGTCGHENMADMSGEKKYFHYELWGMGASNLNAKVTVIYDGQEYTGTFGEVQNQIYKKTGISASYTVDTNQSYDNQWTAGNTYNATVTFMGKSTSVEVTIIPSPVSSIQVEPIELIEGRDGYTASEWGPDGRKEYYCYSLSNAVNTEVIVTYAGEEYTGSFNEVASQISNIAGSYYDFSFFSDQSYENQWIVGNTYDASVSFMGKTAPVKVKIAPNPISSIQVEPIELVEGIHGYTTSEWGPDGQKEYYYYILSNAVNTEVIVTYAGEEYTGSFNEVASQISKITGGYDSFSLISDQSYEKQWTVGNTYDASVSFMGKTAPVKVKIIPDPLESIHIDDLTMSEGAHQSTRSDLMGGNSYLCYTSIPDDTEVTLVYAGKEYKEKYGALSQFMYSLTGTYSYYPTFNSGETAGNQWQVNHTYPASVSLGSKTCTFNVTIAESPFIDIEAEDIEVIEGADGYIIDYPSRYIYSYTPVITMTTKTGEKVTSKSTSYIEYKGERFQMTLSDGQLNNPWEKGPHTVNVQVGAFRTDFTVTVVETPVERIAFHPSQLSIYEGMSEIPAYLLDYTVYFKDGTSIDAEGRAVTYKGKRYLMGLSVPIMKAGERKTVTATLLGKSATFDVECLAMSSVELREADGLKLRIKNEDGSIDEHKVYCMLSEQPLPYWSLYTDKGQFYIDYDYTGDYENMRISILDNNREVKLISNQLKNSKWLKTALRTLNFNGIVNYKDWSILASEAFNGTVTKDNIDAVTLLAFADSSAPIYGYSSGSDEEGSYALVDADSMKSKIKEVFAINGDFSMSLSKNYDSVSNKIKVRNLSAYSSDYLEVISTDNEQGFWLHSIDKGFDAKIVFDDDYKIARINSVEPEPEFIKGDVNGDKAVDAKDLTALARHVAGIVPITDAGLLKAADVNSDGAVDAKDLTHLARYVAGIIPVL